jgi:hypothetical protein
VNRASRREVNDRWLRGRARLRENLSRFVPRVAVYFPFEILVAVIGFLMGFPLLTGLARPTSLLLLLPAVAYTAYAVALVLGSLTVALGLRGRQHPLALASGLQLLGGSYIVYGLAVVALSGWIIGWVGFTAFFILGLLCLARSSYFRRLIDIQTGACSLEPRR